MMPRLFDERVGYFTQGVTDYGTGEQQQVQKRYITRYRLEKKDPNAAMSEPIKPIIYWVDPATPKKWVPYVKKGIEDWQPAFEVAGFKQGHHREGSAGIRRSGLERRGRALLGDPVAAVDDGERGRAAHPRSAQRRDSRSGRAVLPQRPEPRRRTGTSCRRARTIRARSSCRCPTI